MTDETRPAPGPAAPSPLASALDRVGDRWSLLIVGALLDGARRFNELEQAVSGIAPNILTDRLRRLERADVVVGRLYSRRPARLEYALTADGRELAGAMRLLADWGSAHATDAEPVRHGPCGTPLEPRWYCATCGTVVDGADVDESRVL